MSQRPHRHRLAIVRRAIFAGLIGLVGASAAPAWEIRPEAPAADLEELHRHLAPALYPYPRHGAAPLGLLGFEIWVDAAAQPGFASRSFADTTIAGDPIRGALSVARVGLRKGLPGRLDIGASYGKVIGADLDLLSGDLSWALRDGGALGPSIGLRLAGAQTRGSDVYRLRQVGVDAIISQRLTILTVHAGGGLVRSAGRFDLGPGGVLDTTTYQPVLFGGVTLHLLLPRITLELEKGEVFQAAVRVGIGI